MRYSGLITDVLAEGTYDHGDIVQVSFDELHDLVAQASAIASAAATGAVTDLEHEVERVTKRPLHPALGGETPYTVDPRMLFELPIQ